MSREQRRRDQRQPQSRTGGPPSRRTPVKAPSGGGGLSMPLLILAGVVVVVGLLGYLIWTSSGDDGSGEELTDSEKAEQDASPDLPGTFVQAQGRGHHNFRFSQARPPTPFCPGVEQSEEAEAASQVTPEGTAEATATVTPTATVAATETASDGTSAAGTTTPTATQTPQQGCYASNPPTSGRHLGVEREVDVGGGLVVNIPPDPDVYPDDLVIPRDAIPHLLEHAGVFLGWNCEEGDEACMAVVDDMKDLANDRIDNHDNRVALAYDPDLPEGEVAVASWTRYIRVPYEEYDRDTFADFIGTHACRFDPEGFCG